MDDLLALMHRETSRAVEAQNHVLETQIFNVILLYGLASMPLHEAVQKLADDGWCILARYGGKLSGSRHFVRLDRTCTDDECNVLAMALPRLRFTVDSVEA